MENNFITKYPSTFSIFTVFFSALIFAYAYSTFIMWSLTEEIKLPVSAFSVYDVLIIAISSVSFFVIFKGIPKSFGRKLLLWALLLEILYTFFIIVINNYVTLFPENGYNNFYIFIWCLGIPVQVLAIFGIIGIFKKINS